MSDDNKIANASASSVIDSATISSEHEQEPPQPPTPNSFVATPASSVTGIPTRRLKIPSNYGGSTSSVSKIGRLCSHATPKAGPPPRDTNSSMSRESDDNLSSINSAYTDLYQETVKRFTRSSLSPDVDRYSPTRISFKSTSPSQNSDSTRRTSYDNYLHATGRRRSSDHGAVLTFDTEQFIIGQRVWVGGIRPGQIAYIGETHFAPGDWAGVVLDEPNGKNDGCVAGKRYFQCEPKRGIFSRLTRLTTAPLSGAQTPTSPLSKNSPERSRTVSPTSSLMSTNLRSPGKNGLTVGDRVIVSSGFGSRPGVLRYLGETQFASGNWCGIELDEATGKNDGSVDGIRYFECKPKYGVFVPIAKVSLSPSSKKCRLHRSGSRESLTSIGTMNSIATTNTSRMRMNAQRKSLLSQNRPVTTPKTQFSMQDLLRERQNHIEQLLIERDLDREDAQNQALQYQKNINELKSRLAQLEHELVEERKKNEDLQNLVDEATFCGDELNAQTLDYKDKIHDLEKKLTELASGNPSLQSFSIQDSTASIAQATETLNKQIEELRAKLQEQERLFTAEIKEIREEETRLQENIKYLKAENETLQKELLEKDENLEKFSLSESGIENLKRELHLLKAENEKEKLELVKDFEQKLDEKNNEIKQLLDELLSIRNSLATLESDRSNANDECDILRNECKARDEELQQLNEQIAELHSELSMQKAESSTLDELLSTKQQQWSEEKAALAEKTSEIAKLKVELGELQSAKVDLEVNLTKSNAEIQNLMSLRQKLEAQLEEHKELESKTEQLSVENKKLQTANMLLENVQLELKTLSQRTEHSLQEKCQELAQLTSDLNKLREVNQVLEKDASLSTQQMSHKMTELEAQNRKLQESLSSIEAALQNERLEHQQQAQELAEKLKELKSNAEALDTTNKLLDKLREEQDATARKCQELEDQVRQSEENYAQKQLELGDLTRKCDALVNKCTNLEEQNADLEKNIVAARSSGSELQTTVKTLKEEISVKQQSYAERENQNHNERLQLESTIEQLQQQLAKSEQEIAELKERLQKTQEDLAVKNAEITALQEKSTKLELQVSDTLRQNENLQAKCDGLVAENASLQQDLLNLRTTSTDSNAEMVKVTQDLVAKQRAFDELLDKSGSERAALESQLQASQQRIDALCNQVEVLTSETKLVAEQNFKQVEQLKLAEDTCSKQELELSDLNRKLAAVSGKLTEIETANQELQKEVSTLRNTTAEAEKAQLRLTDELATKQKTLQSCTDRQSAERLQVESQLQELNQQLEMSRADAEQLRYELLKHKETNLLLAQEFDTYKAKLAKTTQDELEQIKSDEAAKLQRLTESYEAQLQNAEKSKSMLDEGISSLQNQIKLLQEELLKCQLDFRSKENDLTRQINALTMEKQQLRDNLQRIENEGSTTLTSVQQEKLALLSSIQQLADDVALRDKQIIALTAESEQARLSNANLSSDFAALENKLKNMQESVVTYENEMDAKDKFAQKQEEKISELRGLIEAAQQSIANMSTRNAELSETLQTLEQEKCEITNIFELFEMEADQNIANLVENMKKERADTQAQLREKSDLLTNAEAELTKLKEELQLALQAIHEKDANSSETSSKLQTQLQEAAQKLSENESAKIELQERFMEMAEQLKEYKQVIDEMDDAAKEKAEALSMLELELNTERTRCQQLESTLGAQCEELRVNIEHMERERANEAIHFNNQIKLLQLHSARTRSPGGGGDEIDRNEDNSAHINFLNSIIADMQKKNEELKTRLNTLEANPLDFNQPNPFEHIKKRKPAPRVFCDICDVFDAHETEDCPLQASEDYSPPLSRSASNNNNDPANKKERKLPEPRKYCVSCEVFGHETGECDEECY